MIIGGLRVKTVRSTTAWGVMPASTSATVLGGSLESQVGDAINMNFYGIFSTSGIVSRVNSRTEFASGFEQDIEIVDNRIRLGWQHVFAAWNMEDETCGHGLAQPSAQNTSLNQSESTGGGDALDFDESSAPAGPDNVVFPSGHVVNPLRRRRYWSILPENWTTRTKTYHDAPYSVQQILNSAFNGCVGHRFGWTRNYHERAQTVRPLGIDHTNGVSLANLISEMNEKTGLDVYLRGSKTLKWEIKGVGAIPNFGAPNDESYTTGSTIAAEPTRIRVMGEQMIIQVLNIELKPTWNRLWEKFIGEAAWLREVASRWGLDDAVHWAEVAAKAREITLKEYCEKIGSDDYADYGYFGQVPRMSMSCWSYIEELVFKHYAVDPKNRLFGVLPQDSIRIHDSLLCGVEMEDAGLQPNSKMRYQRDPVEYYPGAKGFVMVKGQPLDALDTRDIDAFHRLRLADTRTTWRVEVDYEIDSCGVGVRFRTPMFIDGDAEKNESIFFYPNKGEKSYPALSSVGGVGAASELMKIVMPNPDYKIEQAEVKASFAFAIGNYWEEYGSGPRYGVQSATGLTAHLLHLGNGSFDGPGVAPFDPQLLRLPTGSQPGTILELLYADGESVRQKSMAVWRGQTTDSKVTQDGSVLRRGVIGAQIGGAVERVSFSVGFADGISETVEMVRSRPTRAFIAEKTLQRLMRLPEMYAGYDDLKREIRNLRRIVQADRYKPQTTSRRSVSHRTINDVQRLPVGGGVDVQTKVARVSGMNIMGGDVVWADGNGKVKKQGEVFAGVALHGFAQGAQSGNVNIAYAGRIPMRVKGKFVAGGMVYGSAGDPKGYSKFELGRVPLGTYSHADAPDEERDFVAMVNLGWMGEAPPKTLTIYDFQQGENGKAKIKISPGFIVCLDPRSDTEVCTYKQIDPLFNEQAAEFEVGPDDTIGVTVRTNPHDLVEYAEIAIKKEPAGGAHAIPPPVEQSGDYFYKLAKFRQKNVSDPNQQPQIEIEELYHCGGPIYHSFKINAIKNRDSVVPSIAADGFEFYDKWVKADARHLLRKLWQFTMPEGTGTTVPIIVKQQEEGQDDYEIIAVRLGERETGDPQIRLKVGEDAKLVRIEGNGVDIEKNGTVVRDGLVVQLGDPDGAGTGSFQSKGYNESTPIKHIEWDNGVVKTNGDVTIKDKDVEPQINVKSAAGVITVEGNGYNAEAGGILVKDGLVVSLNPTGGGCEDGGTGTISLIEEGASTGVPIAQWIEGCVKTNGDVQIVVRDIMVCVDNVPTSVKFLTINAMPTPPPPPPTTPTP